MAKSSDELDKEPDIPVGEDGKHGTVKARSRNSLRFGEYRTLIEANDVAAFIEAVLLDGEYERLIAIQDELVVSDARGILQAVSNELLEFYNNEFPTDPQN